MLLCEAIATPLYMIVQATGKIKIYQLVVFCILLLNLIMSFIVLKIGYSPVSVVVIRCLTSLFLFCYRLFIVSKILEFQILTYIKDVLFKIIVVSLLNLILLTIVKLCNFSSLSIVFISVIISVLTIYICGINKVERTEILNIIKKRV